MEVRLARDEVVQGVERGSGDPSGAVVPLDALLLPMRPPCQVEASLTHAGLQASPRGLRPLPVAQAGAASAASADWLRRL